jgi:hypothetical protein
MEYRKSELSKLVLRSLTNMREAKTRFLPLSINLPNAAALAVQIKARDDFLSNIRRIRISLGRRIMPAGSASRRACVARKSRRSHRAGGTACRQQRHLIS